MSGEPARAARRYAVGEGLFELSGRQMVALGLTVGLVAATIATLIGH